MEHAFKFRLYPNETQKNQIERTFGCCRFVYNHFLAQRMEQYKSTGKTPTRFMQDKALTALKRAEETSWLCDVDATSLQASIQNLDTAYQNFFRHVQHHEKNAAYPKFKSKHSDRQSYKSKCVNMNIRIIDNRHIQLPKLGSVRCAVSKQISGRILAAVISRNPSGKYFVSICCTDVEFYPMAKTGSAVGIVFDLKERAVTSDGYRYCHERYTDVLEKRMTRMQRQLSRKAKGSNNRLKAEHKVGILRERISDQRMDDIHKLTTDLVRKYDVICMKGRDTKSMTANRHPEKADTDFGEIHRQLEYKSARYGKTLLFVDGVYLSDRRCGCCGYRDEGIGNVSLQAWRCPVCGTEYDSGIGTAADILKEGLRLMA